MARTPTARKRPTGPEKLAAMHRKAVSKTSVAKEYAQRAGVQLLSPTGPALMTANRHHTMQLRAGLLKATPGLSIAMEILMQRAITDIVFRAMVFLSCTGRGKVTTAVLERIGCNVYGADLLPAVARRRTKKQKNAAEPAAPSQSQEQEQAPPAAEEEEEEDEDGYDLLPPDA